MGEARAGRRRWVWIAVGAGVPVLVAAGVLRAAGAGAQEEKPAAATVQVDRGEVRTEVATTGTVQPAQTRSLSFTAAGTVESVAVRPGSTVTAGQALAAVGDDAATQAVTTARTALDNAEDALAEARVAQAGATDNRTTVCATDVGAAFPNPSSSVPTAPATAPPPAATEPAASVPTEAAPTKAAPTTAAPTKTACANGQGQDGQGQDGQGQDGQGQNGQGQGGQNGQTGGDAIYRAQQRVTRATTSLADAEDALAGTTITAPIAGRVLTVGGKVGSRVGAGATFITLAGTNAMQISAAFPEADADRLAVGQHAVVTLADRPGSEFAATLVQVAPTGTSDGTLVRYGVVLSFTKAPAGLLVGQSSAIRVTTGTRADVLRVPSTAVHDVTGGSGRVLRAGVQVQVSVGLRGDHFTEVTGGLTEGQDVVRSW